MGDYDTTSNLNRLKEISEKLVETTFQYQRFFEMSGDLLCISSREGKFLKLNDEWTRVLGYSLDELYEMGWIGLRHAAGFERQQQINLLAMQTTGIVDIESSILDKQDVSHLILWRTTPWIDGISYCTGREIK